MNRRDELAQNLESVQSKITNSNVTLIVVAKTYPVEDVEVLHSLGVENFGENRSEEGLIKSAAVPATWHFQGGIQSRKLRDIARWATVIHSLDKSDHLLKLDVVARSSIDIFLQLSLDKDPQRGGVGQDELATLADLVLASAHLRLQGIMCVPPVDFAPTAAFKEISEIHQNFQKSYPMARYLSAGMSNDFEIAIDCGATHIRVGSSILGSRTARQ
ncbi:MAG: YggS family pyridoxal phosphate-dependent enzyme [Candidatus Planktophila sp.]|jgi:PLP dependent protein|tara:strand:- start:4157 stop:4804 length:648 start_codon:yes stop_codon:yes gene_type:complete